MARSIGSMAEVVVRMGRPGGEKERGYKRCEGGWRLEEGWWGDWRVVLVSRYWCRTGFG